MRVRKIAMKQKKTRIETSNAHVCHQQRFEINRKMFGLVLSDGRMYIAYRNHLTLLLSQISYPLILFMKFSISKEIALSGFYYL